MLIRFVVLYGKELQTEQVLVPHVQSIVKTLYDISKEIPSELDTNLQFSGAKLTLRTVASLHLMLYQVCPYSQNVSTVSKSRARL